VLPHHPAQPRHRDGCARTVAAHVRQQRRDVPLAVLDDLEEVAAVPHRPALPGRDAEVTPRRQVHHLRPTAGRARVEEFVSTCC